MTQVLLGADNILKKEFCYRDLLKTYNIMSVKI